MNLSAFDTYTGPAKALIFIMFINLGLAGGYITGTFFYNRSQLHLAEEAVGELSHSLADTPLFSAIDGATTLARNETIIHTAANRLPADNQEITKILEITKFILHSAIVYVLDKQGTTVACTLHGDDGRQTLTGNNYSFRPYFTRAMAKGGQAIYLALGITTKKRGVYVSHQISDGDETVGVIVIKMPVDAIDTSLMNMQYPSALYNNDGVIIASNQSEWLYKTLLPIPETRLQVLHRSRQFADHPLSSPGFNLLTNIFETEETRYYTASKTTNIPGWKAVVLIPGQDNDQSLVLQFTLIGGFLVSLLLVTAISIFERIKTKQLLNEKSKRLELALEGGQLGTWDWHLDTDRVTFDEHWAAMKGYSLSEIEPKLESFKRLVHPEDLPGVYEKLESHFSKKTELYEATFRMRHKNGHWMWILDRGKVVEWNLRKEPVRVCGTHLDITETKQLEQELSQAQKLESVGRLAAGIAHEINTPTQYIGTNMDFIGESYEDLSNLLNKITELTSQCDRSVSEAVKQLYEEYDIEYLMDELPVSIEQTKEGVKNISSVVLAMKRFSHPGPREKTVTDLNEIIETAIIVSRSEWKLIADIQTDLAPEVDKVPLVSDEIGQVILNMIVNSAHAIIAKAKDKGTTEKGCITITTQAKDGYAEMRISDNGCGILQEHLENIYEPFFTTKEVGLGTGQGLAISYDIITNKHGGTINVDSEPGQGCTFTVRLPVN